ncbi:MAG: response regulator [Spirochaetes bacterium]|nr:response regulator [Spirochaetota bacterium]
MDLKYEILLFEDDSDYVDSIERLLDDYLDGLGFKLVLNVEDDGTHLDELISNDNWNLILMDYNLRSSDKGDELIKQIRSHELYTEIIFYSDAHDFEDEIRSDLIDGVYFARGRRNLIEKVKKVIDVTLKKNQDVNNMRGLVIAETIDIESKMEDLILSYFSSDDGEMRKVFEKILEPNFVGFTTKKKCDFINKICKERKNSLNNKQENVNLLIEFWNEFKKLEDDIIEKRNILAHTVENSDDKNTLISKINKNNTTIYVDSTWCIKTRKDIIKHSENLDKLMEQLI